MSLIAANLNKECPFIIDAFSSLDSVQVVSSKNMIYYKTLYNQTKEEINFDTVNKYILPNLVDRIRNDKNFNIFKANNVIIDHIFHDRNGHLVNSISITPEMYDKP